VALLLGAYYGGCDQQTADIVSRYSESLGIAYQIRDDLDDIDGTDEPDDIASMRPSLPISILHERTKGKGEQRALVEKAFRRAASETEIAELRLLLEEFGVVQRCRVLQESYKEQAIRTLGELQNSSLKGLLRRVIGKIFVFEVEEWCSEFESRNASSGETSPQAVG
jgi:geranylgeranyl diphosphate synthase type I